MGIPGARAGAISMFVLACIIARPLRAGRIAIAGGAGGLRES
jgi:hypothetical protein